MRWKVGGNPSATTWVVGLGVGETSSGWQDVDFAFRSSLGRLSVYEKGVFRAGSKVLVNGDVLDIFVGNKQLEYRVNGKKIYSQSIQGTEKFYIDSSFKTGAARLNNFRLVTN